MLSRSEMTMVAVLPCLLATAGWMVGTSSVRVPTPTSRPQPHMKALFKNFPSRELVQGDEWDGLVAKITEYGAFVRMGHEQHYGLLHISSLSDERIEDVSTFIEDAVGPVGSRVRVKVKRLQVKGVRKVSLELLDVVSRQHMEDVVFAGRPGHPAN